MAADTQSTVKTPIEKNGTSAIPWTSVADMERAAVSSFAPFINDKAPGLVAVISRAARYAKIDESAHEIVIDKRALLFGTIATGLGDTPSQSYGNTASWFADWVSQLVNRETIQKSLGTALTGTDALFEASKKGFKIVPSASLRNGILPHACGIAKETVKRDVADLRHVVTALLYQTDSWSSLQAFGLSATDDQIQSFRKELFSRIGYSPEPHEDMNAWARILLIAGNLNAANSSAQTATSDSSPKEDEFVSFTLLEGFDRGASAVLYAAEGLVRLAIKSEDKVVGTALLMASIVSAAPLLREADQELARLLESAVSATKADSPYANYVRDTFPTYQARDLVSGSVSLGRVAPISGNVQAILAFASGIAATESGPIGLRHIMVALLVAQDGGDRSRSSEILGIFGTSPAPIRQQLLSVLRSRYTGEGAARLVRILRGGQQLQIAAMRPDVVPVDPRTEDKLGLRRFADAIAALIAAEQQRPPLSIAVFGPWGSGKTFFMKMISAAIRDFSGSATTGPDQKRLFKQRIIEVWFNAWHYAEGNLWASIVHAILSGLKTSLSPGEDQTEFQKVLVRLEVNKAAQAAAQAELDAAKKRSAEANAALAQATEAAAKKRKEVNNSKTGDEIVRGVWQMTLKAFAPADGKNDPKAWIENISDSAKKAAAYLGRPDLAGALPAIDKSAAGAVDVSNALESKIGGLSDLLEEAKSSTARGASAWAWLANIRLTPQEKFRLGALVLGVFAALLLVTAALEYYSVQIAATLTAVVAAIAPLVGGLTLLIDWGKKHLAEANRAFGTLDTLRKRVEETKSQRLTENEAKVAAARRAVSEAEAEEVKRKGDVQAANAAIKKAEDDLEAASGPELLLRFVAQRLADGDYQKHLGLIHTIRTDMESLQKILEEVYPRDDAKPEAKSVDRIVLYIDDLDRCPPARVVEVLEAVHLLLAFPLFVVVVGVDVRWVSQALRRRYPNQLGDTGVIASPMDYLEKVFQIPFWLPPMDPVAGRRLLEAAMGQATPSSAAIGVRLQPQPDVPKTPTGTPAAPQADPLLPRNAGNTTTDLSNANGGTTVMPAQGTKNESSPDEDSIHPSALTMLTDERNRILSMAEAVGISPRRANRFANLYRLLKASLSTAEHIGFVVDEGRSGSFVTAAILLALATGAPRSASVLLKKLAKEPSDASDYVQTCFDAAAEYAGETETQAFNAARALVGSLTGPSTAGDLQRWATRVNRFVFNTDFAAASVGGNPPGRNSQLTAPVNKGTDGHA